MSAIVRCPTCGALNEEGATICNECDEAMPLHDLEGDQPLRWIETVPPWLRWIVALPGVGIGGAIIVRELESYGLQDVSSGIIYPAAIAVTILAAAFAAAFVAPSYRKQVGLATAFAELVGLLGTSVPYWINGNQLSSAPRWLLLLYCIIPLIGSATAAIALVRSKSFSNAPIGTLNLPEGSAGLQWFLGISAALAGAAAFEGIVGGVNVLLPAYLIRSAALALTGTIGTGIAIALTAAFAPTRKMAAAWIVAGAFCLLSAVSLGMVIGLSARFGPGDEFLIPAKIHVTVVSITTAAGALLGLWAASASARSEASASV